MTPGYQIGAVLMVVIAGLTFAGSYLGWGLEDDASVRKLLQTLLEGEGCAVEAVADGVEALATWEDWRPDLIFMDVVMPGMNGYDLAAHLRRQAWSEDTLMVALTGWGQDEDRRRSSAAGFDHHLVKPAEFSEIEHMCRLRRTRPAPQGTA